MAESEVDQWLGAVAQDEACGPDLEFDPDFGEMERAALAKPDQQFGDKLIPGEPPDWKEVERAAVSLLARTRDLRVLAYLAVARLRLSGPTAFAEVLEVILGLLETRWDHLHPRLDPEDGNDPTPRANALDRLVRPALVLSPLRDAELARSQRGGPVTWRQLGVLVGALKPEDGARPPAEADVRAAFGQSAVRAATVREALARIEEAARAIPAAFDRLARAGSGPNTDELIKLLRQMRTAMDRYAVTPEAMTTETDGEATAAAADAAGPAQAPPTEATGREDAMRLLDLAAEYFRRNEPSSPVPLLIERARRLADMGFLDILRDLAPDAVPQAQHAAGVRDA